MLKILFYSCFANLILLFTKGKEIFNLESKSSTINKIAYALSYIASILVLIGSYAYLFSSETESKDVYQFVKSSYDNYNYIAYAIIFIHLGCLFYFIFTYLRKVFVIIFHKLEDLYVYFILKLISDTRPKTNNSENNKYFSNINKRSFPLFTSILTIIEMLSILISYFILPRYYFTFLTFPKSFFRENRYYILLTILLLIGVDLIYFFKKKYDHELKRQIEEEIRSTFKAIFGILLFAWFFIEKGIIIFFILFKSNQISELNTNISKINMRPGSKSGCSRGAQLSFELDSGLLREACVNRNFAKTFKINGPVLIKGQIVKDVGIFVNDIQKQE